MREFRPILLRIAALAGAFLFCSGLGWLNYKGIISSRGKVSAKLLTFDSIFSIFEYGIIGVFVALLLNWKWFWMPWNKDRK